MALNLTRELAKSGYRRKNHKSLVVNKIKKYEKEEIIKKNNILFEDPNTFLQLPNETSFEYIVNKIPRGPQFDEDDKLITYTLVGNPKYLKTNKLTNLNSSRSTSKKASFLSKLKEPNISRINNNINNYYNIISDKEIKEIFNKYKSKIRENKRKFKNDLISNDECSKTMKQYIDKTLSLQEKCLKKNEDNINDFKNMEDYIQHKMKLKEKTSRNRGYKTNIQNNSMSKDININLGKLIMNSGEEYRLKNEAIALIEKKNNNKKYILPNINQNWEMSLRRPNNFVGSRKEFLNFGTQNYPHWLNVTEKSPYFDEHISKPKKDCNFSSIGVQSSNRTNSIQNLFNLELKRNKTNDDIYKTYFRRNNACETLEIQGEKLIDFEENLFRKLKGKKKILNYKNNKEEVKDMVICAKYEFSSL